MTESNKAIARRLCEEVIGGGNLGLADELVSADFVGHASPEESATQGLEAYKQFVTALHQAFPDLRITVRDQVAEDDKVVSRWIAYGTHQGDFFGMAPSGKQGSMTGITIERFRDGKSVECWTNSDDLGLLRQIGAIPDPSGVA